MSNFAPLGGQVRLAQNQMPGWGPSGAPAFMYASDQVPGTTAPLPAPAAPASAAPATPPAPGGISKTAIGIGIGVVILGVIAIATS